MDVKIEHAVILGSELLELGLQTSLADDWKFSFSAVPRGLSNHNLYVGFHEQLRFVELPNILRPCDTGAHRTTFASFWGAAFKGLHLGAGPQGCLTCWLRACLADF